MITKVYKFLVIAYYNIILKHKKVSSLQKIIIFASAATGKCPEVGDKVKSCEEEVKRVFTLKTHYSLQTSDTIFVFSWDETFSIAVDILAQPLSACETISVSFSTKSPFILG